MRQIEVMSIFSLILLLAVMAAAAKRKSVLTDQNRVV